MRLGHVELLVVISKNTKVTEDEIYIHKDNKLLRVRFSKPFVKIKNDWDQLGGKYRSRTEGKLLRVM